MMSGVEHLSERAPRAVGRRIGYDGLPAFVREWVDARFGPVTVLRDHAGGMSPGCATSLATADGRAVFVKAVGAELNEQTLGLFRRELELLRRLPPAPYRPALLGALDLRGWVAVALEQITGRYPDLGSDADFDAVARVVVAQVAELTPPPSGVNATTLAETAERWAARWEHLRQRPDRLLPGWAAARFDELARRVRALPGQLPAAALCHFDVRDDNLLVRADGTAVVLDWGMARFGPAWTDLVLLAAQKPTAVEAQRCLERWVPTDQRDAVTSFLVAFGGSQAFNAAQPARPSLPTFAAFCREDMRRLLAIARLRLNT